MRKASDDEKSPLTGVLVMLLLFCVDVLVLPV